MGFITAQVKRGELQAVIGATGTVEPEEVVDVGAQVAGQLIKFGTDAAGKQVDYGSQVDPVSVRERQRWPPSARHDLAVDRDGHGFLLDASAGEQRWDVQRVAGEGARSFDRGIGIDIGNVVVDIGIAGAITLQPSTKRTSASNSRYASLRR